MTFAAMLLVGLLIDALCGWPAWLFERISHPVTWVGRLIDGFERTLNHGRPLRRVAMGAATVIIVLGVALAPAVIAQFLLPAGPLGWLIGGIIAWPLIAARSLHDHVKAVADPLEQGDTEVARVEVSKIVGRDPASLDTAAISRASIESLAENCSDGVVAPIFWGVVAGLPGIVAYKVINTLDSMIGHRDERFEFFGKFAARLDDLVNLIPARLTALFFALAAGPKAIHCMRVTLRDAWNHRSPNAGWPESAVAGALDIRLSGPRKYADRVVDEPWLNAGAKDPDATEIFAALSLYKCSLAIFALVLLGLALI